MRETWGQTGEVGKAKPLGIPGGVPEIQNLAVRTPAKINPLSEFNQLRDASLLVF